MSNSTRISVLALAVAAFAALPAEAQTAGSSSSSDWTIKPRGRLQLDFGQVDAPPLTSSANQAQLGPDVRVRRAYLGVDITISSKWGARFEADFAAVPITLTDAYVFYKPRKDLTITAGHHKPFWGLEELTSDNFTTFQERAAYSTAFGFERRVGLSAAYVGKGVVLQGGVFSDDTTALGFPSSSTVVPRAFDDQVSFDARAVLMPKLGNGQLHVGGSIHYRDLKNLESVRYRARPFVRTTDLRFVDTGNLAGTSGELGIGAELAYLHGPFHVSAESYWQKAMRPVLGDRTFNGGYAEVGYMLTGGAQPYKGGIYERLSPKKPVGKGGFGAVELNLRYDWLDLNDGPTIGGRQDMAGVSVVWVPQKHFRFLADYGHFWINNSPVVASDGRRDYEADAFGLRAQFDF